MRRLLLVLGLIAACNARVALKQADEVDLGISNPQSNGLALTTIHTPSHAMAEPAAGIFDNHNGIPDQDDKDWAHKLLAGETIDPWLEFHLDDLLHDYLYQQKSDAANLRRRDLGSTYNSQNDELITELTRLRLGLALMYARCRSRLRQAGHQGMAVPGAEDFAWAQAFMSGQDVDEHMMFNVSDLQGPLDDYDTNYLSLFANGSHISEGRLHWKRTHMQDPTVLQILRQSLRALRHARHRARVRQQGALSMKHHITKWANHLKHDGDAVDGPDAHPIPPSPKSKHKHKQNPPTKPKPKPKPKPHPKPKNHHSQHSEHHNVPGFKPDGSIDCEWFYCHFHVLNCGDFIPDPSWSCV